MTFLKIFLVAVSFFSSMYSSAQVLQDIDHFKNIESYFFSKPIEDDLATAIIENGDVVASVVKLDQMKLTSGAVSKIPWTDSYWPTHKGLIGIRYADPYFPNSKVFLDNFNYITSNPAAEIMASGNPELIDKLSPAEKYDLLVGDNDWTLTRYSWSEGSRFFEKHGRVPTWMGICHGWAAAAHMDMPVASTPIVVISANNIPITFYPSDIKALQSMLWANASPQVRFVGKKCSTGTIERSPTGRIINPECIDNNPATFHLILTNQLGRHKRSFIMDGTYNAEIWNFPMVSYKYKYFNPKTMQPTSDYRKAMIPLAQYTTDKFKEFRSEETKFIIGIIMDDTYVIEITPTRAPQETSPLKTVRHHYDLELNANYEIIGGEWHTNAHPDFIWTYESTALARSIVDDRVNPQDWVFLGPVPVSWAPLAQSASSRGQPMLTIIDGLLSRESPQSVLAVSPAGN